MTSDSRLKVNSRIRIFSQVPRHKVLIIQCIFNAVSRLNVQSKNHSQTERENSADWKMTRNATWTQNNFNRTNQDIKNSVTIQLLPKLTLSRFYNENIEIRIFVEKSYFNAKYVCISFDTQAQNLLRHRLVVIQDQEEVVNMQEQQPQPEPKVEQKINTQCKRVLFRNLNTFWKLIVDIEMYDGETSCQHANNDPVFQLNTTNSCTPEFHNLNTAP